MSTPVPSPNRPSAAGGTWAHAAEALAGRVNRREQRGVLLSRIGTSLLVACVPAVAWRAFGPATSGAGISNRGVVAALLGLGLLVGLVRAWRASAVTRHSSPGDAAWALDRLARAGGRGMAAACAKGPAASEAAFAGGGLALPPSPRLLPPRGLVPLAGGLLLGLLTVLAPAGHGEPQAAPEDEIRGLGAAPSGAQDAAAGAAERRAQQLDREAGQARAVRKALNLPPDGPLDPEEVEARLANGSARSAATQAAGPGTALARALDGTDPSGEHLAGLLDPGGDNRDQATDRRREAAAARARSAGPHIPAARRAIVTDYFQRVE